MADSLIQKVMESYCMTCGEPENEQVMEKDIPVVACPNCGTLQFTPKTLKYIENQLKNERSL